MPAREPRDVRLDDPSLSDAANRLVTDELRDVVGADRVEVPTDAPRRERERHGGRGTLATTLQANRPILLITGAMLLVVAAIVALATGAWWVLPLVLVVHAVGTLVVIGLVGRMTTQVEHLDPDTAARLEAEGVADPDELLSELVDEFTPDRQGPSNRTR